MKQAKEPQMEWYLGVIKKYAEFGGRARRKEYWMFVLINLIITAILGLVDSAVGTKIDVGGPGPQQAQLGILGFSYSLAILPPALGVFVRRLHDTNHSGWWFFIAFIPLVGAIILLVFLVQDSNPGDNKYGPNPKMTA